MTFRVIVTTSVAALAVSFLLGHWAMDESRMSLLPRCKFACYNTDEVIFLELDSVTVNGAPVTSVEVFFDGKLPTKDTWIVAASDGHSLLYARDVTDQVKDIGLFVSELVRR